MALSTGTYTIADLSANVFSTTTVEAFGMDNLNDAIQEDLRIHNERTSEMLRDLAEITTERSTIYGTSADGEMVKKDEFTRGPTQKIRRGSKVEFPLDGYQFAVGWTADYLRRATVQDMALKTIHARQAHLKRIQLDIKSAFFGVTNYTYTDRLVDNNDLAVKRLLNADSAPIPNGPNGETYDAATHTHYNTVDWAGSTAAQRAAAMAALAQDVVEHGHANDLRIYVNRAQETDIRGLDDEGFTPLLVPNIIPGTATDRAVGTLDITRADNRLIGYFNGFPVYTKPWVPANYMLAFAAGDPNKPLRFRQSTIRQEQGLFLAGEIITHPLQSRYMEAFFGVGAFTRSNGAVLYLGHATVYTEPTLT